MIMNLVQGGARPFQNKTNYIGVSRPHTQDDEAIYLFVVFSLSVEFESRLGSWRRSRGVPS